MDYKKLIAAAKKARARAYAPYSGFKVGAAVLTKSGKIFTAANVENASYGLSICAERAAIFKAVSECSKDLVAVAVFAGTKDPVTPCGACRQVIAEFAPEAEVVMVPMKGKARMEKNSKLLPGAFGKKALLFLGLAVFLAPSCLRAEGGRVFGSATLSELMETLRSSSTVDVQGAKQVLETYRFTEIQKPLLKLAKDPNPEARLIAAQIFGEMGKGDALAPLRKMGENDDSASVRRAALIQLTGLLPHSKSTFKYLKGVSLSDPNADNRSLALTHLSIIAADQSYFRAMNQVCWKVWKRDRDRRNRIFAAVILAGHGDNKPVLWDALLDAAKDSSVEIRRRASLLLGAVNDPRLFFRITGIAKDPDAEVRANLCQALAALRNVSGIPALQLLYLDADPGVRKSALGALAQFPRKNIGVNFFVTALGDTDGSVRSEAIRILESLGDRGSFPALERVSNSDQDLAIRYLAKKAIATISARFNP